MKVLVVDDSRTMRRIISNCLSGAGYDEVVEAEDGAQGMEVLTATGGVDLILTDWNMPNVDGLEFLKLVMDSPFKSVPVIMVTTEAEKDRVVQALRAGARNYVVKPFTSEVLEGKIRQTMRARSEGARCSGE